MRHYFYHGFETYIDEEIDPVEQMLEYINSGGIKKRNEAREYQDSSMGHICLYRKNENYNYNSNEAILNSARSGWINHCMVFVISDDIDAKYLPPNTEVEGMGLSTNLVDEWRCFENIPLDKIVGLAIPLDYFKDILDGKEPWIDEETAQRLKGNLLKLREVCRNLGLKVYNSDKENFTDLLDEKLQLGETEKDELEDDILI